MPSSGRTRGLDGFRFFSYALGHHYIFGEHKPGRTDIWSAFEAAKDKMPLSGTGGIGTPDQLRKHLRGFAETGVDQVAFIQQGGNNRHEHICEALELFASDVMPEFKEHEAERQKKKAEELAPYIEKAMARKSERGSPAEAARGKPGAAGGAAAARQSVVRG